ncbi:MAG TPA: energy transducer TonB [Terracidiphilus sp.]
MRRILLATLLSSLSLTAAALPAQQLSDASTPASQRISTGVTSPRLVYTSRVSIPSDELPSTPGSSTKLVLKVNVDAAGNPGLIQVIHSVNPAIDARVVNAVRQFRWTPAVLNNQAVADDITLTVDVQR